MSLISAGSISLDSTFNNNSSSSSANFLIFIESSTRMYGAFWACFPENWVYNSGTVDRFWV
jgi:hypothetical protein